MSVAVIPKLYEPGEPGVPVIVPATASSSSPDGSVPEDTVHRKVAGFPPTAESAALYAAPTAPTGSAAATTYGFVCPLIADTSSAELSTTSRSLTWKFLMHARSLSSQRTSGAPPTYPVPP